MLDPELEQRAPRTSRSACASGCTRVSPSKEADDFFGEAVIQAARIAGEARGGAHQVHSVAWAAG